jgi:hypothetical protein
MQEATAMVPCSTQLHRDQTLPISIVSTYKMPWYKEFMNLHCDSSLCNMWPIVLGTFLPV